MLGFHHTIRTLVHGILEPRRTLRRSAGRATDWLPPVLGPNDWSAGIMADRSAGWYFDRNRE